MAASPREPSKTMRILSSAEQCLRMTRPMSRTRRSDDDGIAEVPCVLDLCHSSTSDVVMMSPKSSVTPAANSVSQVLMSCCTTPAKGPEIDVLAINYVVRADHVSTPSSFVELERTAEQLNLPDGLPIPFEDNMFAADCQHCPRPSHSYRNFCCPQANLCRDERDVATCLLGTPQHYGVTA
jgi:hypothetical protein